MTSLVIFSPLSLFAFPTLMYCPTISSIMNTSPRVPPSAATQLSPETLYQTSSHVENGVGQRVYSVVSNGSDSDTKFVEEAKVPESRRYIRRWHAPLIGQQILGDRISRFSCVKQTIFMLALLLIRYKICLDKCCVQD